MPSPLVLLPTKVDMPIIRPVANQSSKSSCFPGGELASPVQRFLLYKT